MKALVQRVTSASVSVDGEQIASIEKGMLVFLGVAHADTEAIADSMVEKLLNYRMFSDQNGKMNLDIQQVRGSILLVSQFTLMAQTAKGLRPGFSDAGKPELANALYEYVAQKLREEYSPEKVSTGRFAADMQVGLVNDGPVTFMLEKTGSE